MNAILSVILDCLFPKMETSSGKKIENNPHEIYKNNIDQDRLNSDDALKVIQQAGYNEHTESLLLNLRRHQHDNEPRWLKLKFGNTPTKKVEGVAFVLCILGVLSNFNVLLATGLTLLIWSRWRRYQLWKALDEIVVLDGSTDEILMLNQTSHIKLTIKNRSKYCVYDLLVYIDCPCAQYGVVWACFPRLEAESSGQFEIPFSVHQGIGHYTMTDLVICISDGLGFHTLCVKEPIDLAINVLPGQADMIEYPLPEGKIPNPAGIFETQKEGMSCNFFQLRPWRYGDSVTRIHWGRSLALDTLLVQTFESTASLEANLIIDCRRLGHCAFSDLSSRSDLINAFYSFCHYFNSHRIAFRAITEYWDTGMGIGAHHLQSISESFMSSPAFGEQSFAETLLQYADGFSSGSILILFVTTAGLDIESVLTAFYALIKNDIQIVVIAIDSTVFGSHVASRAKLSDGVAWASIASYEGIMTNRESHPEVRKMKEVIDSRTYLLRPYVSINETLNESRN